MNEYARRLAERVVELGESEEAADWKDAARELADLGRRALALEKDRKAVEDAARTGFGGEPNPHRGGR